MTAERIDLLQDSISFWRFSSIFNERINLAAISEQDLLRLPDITRSPAAEDISALNAIKTRNFKIAIAKSDMPLFKWASQSMGDGT